MCQGLLLGGDSIDKSMWGKPTSQCGDLYQQGEVCRGQAVSTTVSTQIYARVGSLWAVILATNKSSSTSPTLWLALSK